MQMRGLKYKLSLSIVAIIAFLGLLATFMVYQYASEQFLSYEKGQVELTASEKAGQIETVMNYGLGVVSSLSGHEQIAAFVQSTEGSVTHDQMLAQLIDANINDIFSAIYIMDQDGLTLVSTDERFTGNNYGFRTYFQSAKEGEVSVDVARGVTSGKIGFYFSSPVYNDLGAFAGVVVAKLEPEQIAGLLELPAVMRNAHVMLIDRFGVVIYAGNVDHELMTLSELTEQEFEEVRLGRYYEGVELNSLDLDQARDALFVNDFSLIEDEDDGQGESYIIGLQRIENTPFHLIVMESYDAYLGTVQNLAYLISLFVLLAAVLAALIISGLISRFLAPLDELRAAAGRISKSDFAQEVVVKQKNELGILAEAFNSMMSSLRTEKDRTQKKIGEQTEKLQLQKGELESRQSAMMNILEDIAEEKEKSEHTAQDLRKFKLAVDGASDHIVLTDADGIVLYANPAVERITGFAIEEVMGQKAGVKELWGGMMDVEFYKKLWESIKIKKQVFVGELLNKRKNGDIYEAAATITPILDNEGEVLFFLGIERDITVEKNIERAKSDFVSLASHQLRTPLTAIRWYLDLLLEGDVGELTKEQIEYLGTIKESNVRMVNLVNSLLNVSRLELGTFSVEPEEISIIDLVKTELAELKVAMSVKKITSHENYSDAIEKLKLDKNLTSIVTQNILSNAVKYTKEGGEVFVDLYEGTENGNESKTPTHVIFKVRDTGEGIPQKDQHRIFEKMFRADNARAIDPEGNGLGLYMVKKIVEETGGKIWFESIEGEGTTFFVAISKKGMRKREGTKKLTSEVIKVNGHAPTT